MSSWSDPCNRPLIISSLFITWSASLTGPSQYITSCRWPFLQEIQTVLFKFLWVPYQHYQSHQSLISQLTHLQNILQWIFSPCSVFGWIRIIQNNLQLILRMEEQAITHIVSSLNMSVRYFSCSHICCTSSYADYAAKFNHLWRFWTIAVLTYQRLTKSTPNQISLFIIVQVDMFFCISSSSPGGWSLFRSAFVLLQAFCY